MPELRQDAPSGECRTSGAPRPTPAPWPRWRVLLIRIWAGLLTLLMLAMARGVLWVASADPDEQYMYATSTVWKLLSLGGAAWVLWTGGRSVLAYWLVALGQLVWLLAGVLNPEQDGNGLLLSLVNLIIYYGPLVALRPERRQLLHPGLHPSPQLLAVSLVAAGPLLILASRTADRYPGSELGFDMTGLYLALAAFALFAALRPAGGALLPYFISASVACTGLAAVLLPDDDASPGLGGGMLLSAWAVAFAVTAAAVRAEPRGR